MDILTYMMHFLATCCEIGMPPGTVAVLPFLFSHEIAHLACKRVSLFEFCGRLLVGCTGRFQLRRLLQVDTVGLLELKFFFFKQ